jgi:hypothetical protein
MQSISVGKSWGLILAAMICAEIAGLVYYRGSEFWASFLVLSFVATTSTAALLYSQRLGTPPGSIAFYLFVLSPTNIRFQRSSRTEAVLNLAFAVVIVAILIWETLENRKAKENLNSKYDKGKEPAALVFGLLGPLGSLVFAGLLAFNVIDDFVLFGDHSLLWFGPILPPFCWYLHQYVHFRRGQKILNPTEDISILQ